MSNSHTYQHIQVTKMTTAVGAIIHGLDLSKPLDSNTVSELLEAYHQSFLLCIPKQNLTVDRYIEISRIFGNPTKSRKFRPYDEEKYPLVGLLEQDGTERFTVGSRWHSDNMDCPDPYSALVFYAEAIPSSGGDTLVSNMHAAYETLSPAVQKFLEGFVAINDNSLQASSGGFNPNYTQEGLKPRPPVTHPVVRTHPVTKKKSLYVNPVFTRKIVGLSDFESESVLKMLFTHIERTPEIQCRIKWEPDMFVVFDNRNTQHYACADYRGLRRLRRIEIEGEAPF